jgi:hypothetical protein
VLEVYPQSVLFLTRKSGNKKKFIRKTKTAQKGGFLLM